MSGRDRAGGVGGRLAGAVAEVPGDRPRVGRARIIHGAGEADSRALRTEGGRAVDCGCRGYVGHADGTRIAAHAAIIIGDGESDEVGSVVIRRETETGRGAGVVGIAIL